MLRKNIFASALVKFILTVCSACMLLSCSNLFSGVRGSEHPGLTSDGKAYMSITLGSARLSQRSISSPSESEIISKLKDFVLTGKHGDSDEFKVLAKAGNSGELASLKIPVELGMWTFTLSAKLGSVSFSASREAEIQAGASNAISFTLDSESPYGGMSITLEFTGDADRVTAELKDTSNQQIEKIEFTSGDFASVSKNVRSVTYARSAGEEASALEKGTYYLAFNFYAEGLEEPLNTAEYYVRVSSGVTTASVQKIDLNEVYSIDYSFWLNDSEVSEDYIEISPESDVDVFPLKYSRKSDVTVPALEYKDPQGRKYLFDGWYNRADFTEDARFDSIRSGQLENKTLYARFITQSELYVTARVLAADEEDTGNGTSSDPFATLAAAFDRIEFYGNDTVDYKIIVSGMTTENSALLSDAALAKSVLIEGEEPSGCGMQGVDGVTSSAACLRISSAAPVTIRNFTVMPQNARNGASSGMLLNVAEGADVTLSSGTVLDGTGAGSYGTAGIYVEGKAVMEDDALLQNIAGSSTNILSDCGGVYVCGKGSFTMKDTSRIIKCQAFYGGAIHIEGSEASAELSGSAVIGEENNGCSAKYSGGGVYVKDGSFTMKGGEIAYCTGGSNGGGGVYVESGTFDMSGGKIHSNNAGTSSVKKGGGIYGSYGSLITMTGGEISSNTSGSGVYLYRSDTDQATPVFDMKGGSIHDNKDYGVYVHAFSSYSAPYEAVTATFRISGDATVGSPDSTESDNPNENISNTVYLATSENRNAPTKTAYAYVTLSGDFTGWALIEPGIYEEGRQVFAVDDGADESLVASLYKRFALKNESTPNPETGTGWNTGWNIQPDGTISKYRTVASLNHQAPSIRQIKRYFTISTEEELLDLADFVQNLENQYDLANATFELRNDIELTSPLEKPIGTFKAKYDSANRPFSSVFDGKGHAIKGVDATNLVSDTNVYGALFGFGGDYCIIRNLTVEGSASHAGIVGWLEGNDVEISNCTSNVTVTCSSGYAGGIASITSGTIKNCVSNGDVTNTGSGSSAYTGGILGYCSGGDGVVDSCVNNGKVTGSASYTAGIVASNYGSVINCMNTGDVSGGSERTGGIVGEASSYKDADGIQNCCNTGNITGSRMVGGIAGWLENGTNTKILIKNCWTKGTVSGSSATGVAAGEKSSSADESKVEIESLFYVRQEGFSGINGIEDTEGTLECIEDDDASKASLLEKLNSWVESNNAGGKFKKWTAGEDGWPVLSL